MLKMEKDYIKEYGEIPKDSLERMDYMLKDINLHRAKLKVYEEIDRISRIKGRGSKPQPCQLAVILSGHARCAAPAQNDNFFVRVELACNDYIRRLPVMMVNRATS